MDLFSHTNHKKTLILVLISATAFSGLFSVSFCQLIKSELILGSGEDFDLIEYVLINATESISIEEFLDDAQLTQRVDRINEYSEYRGIPIRKDDSSADEGEIIYKRKVSDVGEIVLVLHQREDNLKSFDGSKRVFVVLRQNPFPDKVAYYVNYVYLRSDVDAASICGTSYIMEKICFEWAETWDGNRFEVKSPVKYFGWSDCSTSFFTTCRSLNSDEDSGGFNMDMDNLIEEDQHSPVQLMQGIGKQNDNVPDELPFTIPVEYKEMVHGDFSDTTNTILWDLDNRRAEGYHVKEVIKDTSVIPDPLTASAMLFKRDGKLKGFNSGVKPDNALIAMMENAKEKYNKKYDKDNLIENQGNAYDLFRENIQQRNHLLVRIHELYGLIRNISKWKDQELDGHVKSVYLLSEDRQNAFVKNKLTELSNLETQLKELDRNNSKLKEELHNTANKPIPMSDIFENPGWKFREFAQLSDSADFNLSASNDQYAFYGFGTCEFIDVSMGWSEKTEEKQQDTESTNVLSLVDFYLKALRLQCIPEAKYYVAYLVDSGYLEMKGNIFNIPEELEILKKPKLSLSEYRMLSASLEFSVFSQTYNGLRYLQINGERPISLRNLLPIENLSETVNFILYFVVRYIEVARKNIETHFIKTCRNLVITLRGIMVRLIQDEEILSIHCRSNPICSDTLKNNYSDRFAINAAIQFLLHGLTVMELNRNVDSKEMLGLFYKDNYQSIELGLKYYETDSK